MKLIFFCLLVALSIFQANGQSGAEWSAYKQQNGIDSHWAYNDWVAAGSPHNTSSSPTAPAAPAAPGHEFDNTINQAISAGMSGKISGGDAAGFVGLGILGNALFAPNTVDPAQQQAQQEAQREQQQRQLAAQQLNNSGLYLLKQKNYAGAINEFQQALAQTPGDPNIIQNIAAAKKGIKDTAVAAKNSGALSQLLGNTPADSGKFDFDQLTHSSLPSPNSSALNLVNLDSNPNVVDLLGTTKTAVDLASLKSQIVGLFGNSAPASTPPDPRLQLPEAKDIKLLFDPPQPTPSQWPGQQRPASDPKLVNPLDAEAQTKAQTEAVFAQPGGADDILQQKIQDDALNGLAKPAHVNASVTPSNGDKSVGSLAESSAAVIAAQARAKTAFDQYVEKYGADGHIAERTATVAAAARGEGYSQKELQEQHQKALLDYQKRHADNPPADILNGGHQPAVDETSIGGKG